MHSFPRQSVIFSCFVFLLIAQVHHTFGAAEPSQLKALLQSKYDNMNYALAHEELNQYLSYQTQEYFEKGPHDKVICRDIAEDRSATLHNMQWLKHFDDVNHINFHYHDDIKTIVVTGNIAYVVTLEHSSIQPQLIQPENDVWVKQNNKWLMKQRISGKMYSAPPSES